MQALILFIFVKIFIIKKQKEMLFSYFFLKLFIGYQHVSLKRLLNNFIYNQNIYIMKILYYALINIINISN